jgi:hypothetical protein
MFHTQINKDRRPKNVPFYREIIKLSRRGFSGSNSQEGPPPKDISSLLFIEIPIDISILMSQNIHIERIIEIRLRLHTIKITKKMMFTLYREKHILTHKTKTIHTIPHTLHRETKMS